ncbi:MAG: alpha/beta fold hydrolase [Chloroflexi bacterium]|nr:alpha/beta fold hydrolase [Chloroflexota bacterium]
MDREVEAGCDVIGPPDGPHLVLVHGSRTTRASWQAVTDRLAGSFRIATPDLPGHGALADVPFTLEGATDVLEATIEAVGGPPVLLVGLSLGGYVAAAYAASHPERVRGLVLAGSTAEPGGSAAAVFRLYAWAIGSAPQRPLDALNTWFLRRRYAPEIAEPIIAAGYWSRGGAAAIRALGRESFRDRLLAYGGPILAINGELDLVFRIGARSFLRGVPNVTRRTLSRASHLSPLDRPDAFAEAIRRFEARLASRAARLAVGGRVVSSDVPTRPPKGAHARP